MVGFVPEIRNHTMQLEQSPAVSQATEEVTAAVFSSVHALVCCSVVLCCCAQTQDTGLIAVKS